ncbi:hypothetical protein KAW43_03335 [Candidatus Parcubacteria bacterium]|nr:hypothetical protein [Candidatus Parcubacteria bacterium]
MENKTERKNYASYGIIWAGSIIFGAGIGMLMDNIEAGGAMGVGMAFILTAIFYPDVYR